MPLYTKIIAFTLGFFLAGAISSLIPACTSVTPKDVITYADATTAVIDLEKQYIVVRAELLANREAFKPDDRPQLDTLIRDTDDFVAVIKAKWNKETLMSLPQAGTFYNDGQRIYLRATSLLGRNFDSLPPLTRFELKTIQRQIVSVDAAYKRFQAQPDLQHQSEMLQAGVSIAVLVGKIALAAL